MVEVAADPKIIIDCSFRTINFINKVRRRNPSISPILTFECCNKIDKIVILYNFKEIAQITNGGEILAPHPAFVDF